MDRQLLKRLRRVLEIAIVVGVLAFLGRYTYLRWQSVQEVQFRLEPGLLALGVLLLFLFYALMSFSWQRLLVIVGGRPEGVGSVSLHRAFIMAFLTRYLPGGNVLTVGGRVELLSRLGGSRSLGLESVYYEQLYLTVGAFILGIASAPFMHLDQLPAWLASRSTLVLALVALITAMAALGPELAVRVAVRLSGREGLRHLGTRLTWRHKFEMIARFIGINLVQGASATFFLLAVFRLTPRSLGDILPLLSAYPLSRFVGQAAAIIPGGLGIREGAYALLLDSMLPIRPVVISAAILRLVSVLLELLLAGAVIAAERLSRRSSNGEAHR